MTYQPHQSEDATLKTADSREGTPSDASREAFEAHVKNELGDVPVMDNGRYISPKIQNYWRTWQAALSASPSLPPHDAVGVRQEVVRCGYCSADMIKGSECRNSTSVRDCEMYQRNCATVAVSSSAPATPSAEPVAWQLRKHVNGVWRDWEPCRQADHEGIQAEAKHWGMQYESRALYASPTPVLADSRPPTTQEDQWLRDAAKRSSTLVAPGKLADGVLGGPVGAPIPAGVGEVDRG